MNTLQNLASHVRQKRWNFYNGNLIIVQFLPVVIPKPSIIMLRSLKVWVFFNLLGQTWQLHIGSSSQTQCCTTVSKLLNFIFFLANCKQNIKTKSNWQTLWFLFPKKIIFLEMKRHFCMSRVNTYYCLFALHAFFPHV